MSTTTVLSPEEHEYQSLRFHHDSLCLTSDVKIQHHNLTFFLPSSAGRITGGGGIIFQGTIPIVVRGHKLSRFHDAHTPAIQDSTDDLQSEDPVFDLIQVSPTQLFVVFSSGSCEVRLVEEDLRIVAALDAAAMTSIGTKHKQRTVKKSKGDDRLKVVAARWLQGNACVVLVMNDATARLVRIEKQGKQLEKVEIELGSKASAPFTGAAVHVLEADSAAVVNSFGVSLWKDDDPEQGTRCWSFQVRLDTLNVESLLAGFVISSKKTAMDAGLGGRLYGYDGQRIVCWDYAYGVALEYFPIAIASENSTCELLRVSPTGKFVAFGDKKSVSLVDVSKSSTTSRAPTLARALVALKQSSTDQAESTVLLNIDEGGDAPADSTVKTRATKRKAVETPKKGAAVKAVAAAPTEDKRFRLESERTLVSGLAVHMASRRRRSFVEATADFALSKKWFQALIRMVEESTLQSTRGMRGSPLKQALESGKIDFITLVLEKFSDVPALHIVDCVLYAMYACALPDTEIIACKALELYGGGSLDAGCEKLIVCLLANQNVVESELAQAFRYSLTRQEEIAVLVSCICRGAEEQTDIGDVERLLSTCSSILDALPTLDATQRSSSQSACSLGRLRNLVHAELTVCEKHEQAFQRVRALLDGSTSSASNRKTVGGEYQTEIVLL